MNIQYKDQYVCYKKDPLQGYIQFTDNFTASDITGK